MSKQDILDFFSDINYAYNDSTRLVTLNRMLDELIEDAASPWHMVEEELPSEFQGVWAACKMNGGENWTFETVYDPYLSCPWGHIPVLDSGKAIVYAWMDRTAPEPPKEDA